MKAYQTKNKTMNTNANLMSEKSEKVMTYAKKLSKECEDDEEFMDNFEAVFCHLEDAITELSIIKQVEIVICAMKITLLGRRKIMKDTFDTRKILMA